MKVKFLPYSAVLTILSTATMVPTLAYADDVMEVGEFVAAIADGGYPGSMLVSWRFMADESSPIEWKEHRLGMRQGSVFLSVDGVVPDILQENITPSPWDIKMTGPNAGPVKINLSSGGCYDFDQDGICDNALEPIVSSLYENSSEIEEVCRFGAGSVRSHVYHLQGLNSIYLGLLQHAGSSIGYSYEMNIIPSLAGSHDRHPLEEKSNVCAAFFDYQFGDSGTLYINYLNFLDN